MGDAPDTQKKAKSSSSTVGVRVRPGSVVDVVDLPDLQVRAGHVVRLAKKQADAAVSASRVLELVRED